MDSPGFYELSVHSVPDNINTAGTMVRLAKRLGYACIAITNTSGSCKLETLSIPEGIGVLKGVELSTDNASRLHGLVGKYINIADIIVVRGGNEDINRAAVENPNVDVLLNSGSSKDGGLNHILARSASDNNVSISFDIGELIGHRGGRRVRTLSSFRKDMKLVRKYDVPFMLTANARCIYDMRAPRELMALAGMFGMTYKEALSGLSSNPQITLSRKKHSKNYVFDGVEIVDGPSHMIKEEGDRN